MRTILATVAVLAGGLAWAADDDAAKAKATVEKAIKAAGWEKQGANHTWTDKGQFTAMGMTLDYTGEWWFSGPDKYRFAVKLNAGGTDLAFTAAVNGKKAWQAAGDQWEEMKDEKLEYTLGQTYLFWVYTLNPLVAEKEFTLKPAAGVKVDGKETVGVTVTRKDRPTATLYFDADTGLLARADTTMKDEFDGWKETTDETYFSAWKAGDDKMKHATKMKVVRGGKTLIETEQSGHKQPEKLEAKLFEGK